MSEMIERVARALYECPGSDLLAKAGHAFPIPAWGNAHSAVKDDCRIRARAAIEAMREPTGTLADALQSYALRDEEPIAVIWDAIIDAALKTE